MTSGTPENAAKELVGNERPTIMERMLHQLRMDRCPACEQQALQPGPRAGLSINLTCAVCGARWNVAPPRYVMFAERIE